MTAPARRGSAFALDPELAEVLARRPPPTPADLPAVGDVKGLRRAGDAASAARASLVPAFPAGYPLVSCSRFVAPALDGSNLELRWYTRAGSSPGTAVVFAHGGGLVGGSLDLSAASVAGYVTATRTPFLAVGYRRAPEATWTTPAEDVLAALVWLHGRAADLGVEAGRIALMGESAGGGLAAAAAILARERGVSVGKQVLVYPMLDDRTSTVDAERAPFLAWRPEDNVTAWGALLGERAGGDGVPATAAPAREADVRGLPPAYVEVGELDLFRDEAVRYAERLMRAGVPTELHVRAGATHAFELAAPDAGLARRALGDRARVIAAL